jgi:LuxR family transcriptional regulator, maltose regulon positive regulatory protein
MPKSACYTLTWLSSSQAYELYEGQGEEALDLVLDSPAWSEWLSQISSFAFHGHLGSYTARKEHKRRGGEYWYAYARVAGKLTKRYLGRGTELTLTRLEQVAQALWREPPAAVHQEEGRAPSRPRPASHMPPGETIFLSDDLSAAGAWSSDGARSCRPRFARRDNGVGGRKTEHASGVGVRKDEVSPAIFGLPPDMLLASKLQVPRPRPHLVHRPRLLHHLQQGLERALTLISAPAGFGKSTLLADWLVSFAIPATWFSLEPQDNDLSRFLSYLRAALQTYDPQLRARTLALHHPLSSPPLEAVLTLLMNDLQARMTGDRAHLVLVLDNYQVITDESIHAVLSFLLEHLPAHLHLVLASRQDPPLPLALLRGRDDLLELRAADLQFTHGETATYLVEVMGLPLSAEESALLHDRTEGWITGLQLAALSLQGRDDPSGFIANFNGSHHYVADYLLEEVLSRHSEAIQDFLLQTSILDRLSGPLCDAVLAQHDSQAQLGFLEQANLFLVPLDDERRWYRYHHLFAQVLQHHLQRTAPTLIPELHRRASRWYEQHGFFVEAISHALAAAFEEADDLIGQCAWTSILASQWQKLYEWLHTLPEILVVAHPSLRLLYALALMYTKHWEQASAHLQAIEGGLDPAEDTHNAQACLLLGQVNACRSLLARLCGDLELCVAFAQRALERLPETESTPLTRLLRVEAGFNATHAYLVDGDVTPARECLLAELVADGHVSGYRLLTLRGRTLLARLQVLQGRLKQAAATYEEVAQVILGPEELQLLVDNPAYYFGLGDLLREWNELEAAQQYLARGLDLLKEAYAVGADKVWLGYATLARLQQARGRHDQALATLDAFLQLAQQRHFAPLLLAQAAALQAQLKLAQGELPAARQWAASSGLPTDDGLCYPREPAYLTLARIRLAEELVSPTECGLADVLRLLERLLAQAETNERMHSVLEILLVLAQVLEGQGDRTAALATLGRALVLAEPEGYVRLFLDEGPALLTLLRQGQRHGLAPRYIARLLEAAGALGATAFPSPTPTATALVEPLTARECDVLQLMQDGASNREIACQLVLSVNTVKKHVLNICSKLNVQRRAQAIAKAGMLQLT